MKRVFPTFLAVIAGFCAHSHGQDALLQPVSPAITRTIVEFIEVPRKSVDEWFLEDSPPIADAAIREKLDNLIDSGVARVIDQLCLTSSRTGMIQSGPFSKKPAGFMPARAPENLADFAQFAPPGRGIADFVGGPSPMNWYDEHLGATLRVAAEDRDTRGAFSQHVIAELTYLSGRTIHQEWKDSRGRADITTNITSVVRFDGSLKLKHGRPVLAAHGPPCDVNGVPDPNRMVMTFVRGDQLVSPLSQNERVRPDNDAGDPFRPGTEPVPSIIRTTVELIKVPFKRQRGLLGTVRSSVGDDDLHRQVDEWLESGEAELLDIRMHAGDSHSPGDSHAGTQTRIPANYDFGTVLGQLDERTARLPDVVTPPFPEGWEVWGDCFNLTTREMSVEQSSRISGVIGLRWQETTGETIWREWKDTHGDQSIKTADAQVHDIEANILSHTGQWLLIASLNPPDQRPGHAPSHKILMFAKSEAFPLRTP